MHNFWGHLSTITIHKWRVMKLCFRCGLYKQGLKHDLSNILLLNLFRVSAIFKGTAARLIVKRNYMVTLWAGCITKAEILIIGNTG